MNAIFEKYSPISTSSEAQCVTDVSKSPREEMIAAGSSDSGGMICIFAAYYGIKLHEFATMYSHIVALRYTRFSDTIITLELDMKDTSEFDLYLCAYHEWRDSKHVKTCKLLLQTNINNEMVHNAFHIYCQSEANKLTVCNSTGRVAFASGSKVNVWQCKSDMFDHIMEIQVHLRKHLGLLNPLAIDSNDNQDEDIKYLAMHNTYIAFASSTEVQVLEIHIETFNEHKMHEGKYSNYNANTDLLTTSTILDDPTKLPQDSPDCITFSSQGDLQNIPEVPISYPASIVAGATNPRNQKKTGGLSTLFDTNPRQSNTRVSTSTLGEFSDNRQPTSPVVVLSKKNVREEIQLLSGILTLRDIRFNERSGYSLQESTYSEDDSKYSTKSGHYERSSFQLLFQRFVNPNSGLTQVEFLKETMGDSPLHTKVNLNAKLLLNTADKSAYIIHFLASHDDSRVESVSQIKTTNSFENRKFNSTSDLYMMSGQMTHSMATNYVVANLHSPSSRASEGTADDRSIDGGGNIEKHDEDQPAHVILRYDFAYAAVHIVANSSYLYTLSNTKIIDVWSLWSPCARAGRNTTLSDFRFHPVAPQLLTQLPTQSFSSRYSSMIPLDGYLILLPSTSGQYGYLSGKITSITAAVQDSCTSQSDFELRFKLQLSNRINPKSASKFILAIKLRSPTTLVSQLRRIFGKIDNVNRLSTDSQSLLTSDQMDLLWTLLIHYQDRIEMTRDQISKLVESDRRNDDVNINEDKKILNKEHCQLLLEIEMYDMLVKKLASDIAFALVSTKNMTLLKQQIHFSLSDAARLFVMSDMPPIDILGIFHGLLSSESKLNPYQQHEVRQAMSVYIDTLLFSQPRQLNESNVRVESEGGPLLTHTILQHYISMDNAAQLHNLVLHAPLSWTKDDLQEALGYLATTERLDVEGDTQMLLARLVLSLRAAEYLHGQEILKTMNYSGSMIVCIETQIKNILGSPQGDQFLVEVCVKLPTLLLQRDLTNENVSGRLLLTQALLKQNAPVLFDILDEIVKRGIEKNSSTSSQVAHIKFSMKVLETNTSLNCIDRLSSAWSSKNHWVELAPHNNNDDPMDIFTHICIQVVLLQVLSNLAIQRNKKMAKDARNNAETLITLFTLQQEFIHSCILFEEHWKNWQANPKIRLRQYLNPKLLVLKKTLSATIPPWIKPVIVNDLQTFNQHDKALWLSMYSIIFAFMNSEIAEIVLEEYGPGISNAAYKQQTNKQTKILLILQALAIQSNVIDGLQLLEKMFGTLGESGIPYMLGYGRHFCKSLADWRCLLKIASNHQLETNSSYSEVFSELLLYLASLLSPQDFLSVLPTDGDLLYYIDAIEANTRFNEAKQTGELSSLQA